MRAHLGLTIDRIADRIGGARIFALPLLRALAMVALVVWLALAPAEYRHSRALIVTVVGFLAYSLAVEAALWWRPTATLRLNFYVLLIDQAFALALIYLTGGARNAFYLALLLIAGLQAYVRHPRARRGRLVRDRVCRPRLAHDRAVDVANVAIRIVVLLGGRSAPARGGRRRARAEPRGGAHDGGVEARSIHPQCGR